MSTRVAEVEARSGSLRKELGVVDLALAQILYIVGTGWVGTAAKLGHAHLAFWLAAIVMFYLPQAAVVIYLNRRMPLEGGIYQWATAAFGEGGGFLVAWNLWAYTLLMLATFGVMVAQNIGYILGPGLAAVTATSWWSPALSVLLIGGVTALALRGLGVAKWVQNVGAVAQVLTYVALLAVPWFALSRGTLHAFHPLRPALPPISAYSVNIFSKMALGAFSGFEYVALLAGECRSPARSIGRSVMVAVPIVALMFILGTDSVVALVPNDRIDLVSPIPQTLTIGYAGLSFARLIVPALVCLVVLRQLGNSTLIFAGNTRLPMVAGWDGLLPRWFTRLDPRWRTPRNSILFVGGLTIVLSLAGQLGVGRQEAFQLLDNAAGVFYALCYAALFAIPLLGARRLGVRPPLWLRLACAAGLGTSLLYSVMTVFPIIDVPNWHIFAAKILGVLLGGNLVGFAVLAARRWSSNRRLEAVAPRA
ncbi:MAG TPA: APC family permease [Longimicrobiales bacterium]